MKIGFSGMAATGKTTLVNVLAKELGCTVVAEGIPPNLFNSTPPEFSKALLMLARKKRAAIEAAEACVIDRTSLDFAMMALNQQSIYRFPTAAQIIDECRTFSEAIDLMFLTPNKNVAPAENMNEAGLHRRSNRLQRLKNRILIEGLAREFFPPSKLVIMPDSLESVEDRAAWCLQVVTDRTA